MGATMQVVEIPVHGDPSVLSLERRPVPEPGPGEVLARVLAVSVNHLDLWVRRGLPGLPIPLPHVPGCDAVGEVVGLGEGVREPRVGQRVVLEPGFTHGDSDEVRRGDDHLAADYGIRGEHGPGYDREFVALPARYARPLPEGIDPVEAAAVPLVFLTAWGMLVTRARLCAGESVLVIGGASGVGSAAIQIARDKGARVLATAGSERKRALAAELGAEAVFDHGRDDWHKDVLRHQGGEGVDVVFEHVGPATWSGSMRCLGRGGRLVTCGGTTGPKVEVVLPHLFSKHQSILGSTMGPRAALGEIFERVADGRYRPVVDRVLPMSQVVRAHELLEGREVSGKVVLRPGE